MFAGSQPLSIYKISGTNMRLIKMGNLKKAVEVLQEAIEVFPAFKSQGEQFIKQMKAGTIKID